MRFGAMARRTFAVAVAVLSTGLLVQCSDSDDPFGGGGASIAISPASVSFAAMATGATPTAQQVAVTNGADAGTVTGPTPGFVGGLATSITYSSGATGWLTATLSQLSDPAQLTLQPRNTRVIPGTHTATVTVSGKVANSGAALPSKTISVTYQVDPGPAIAVSATSLDFETWAGGPDPAAKTSGITNNGVAGSVLDGLSVTTTGGAWLRATLSGVSAPSQITVNPSAAGLATGTYNGTVSVASDVVGTPRTISVAFRVLEGPKIALNPSTGLSFSMQVGQAIPAAKSVTITNSGGATSSLTGLAVGTITYSQGASGWVGAQLNGTTAPATLSVQPLAAAAQLTAGTYTATIPVTSTVTGVAAAPVTVTLQVSNAPTIVLNPTDVSFQADINAQFPAAVNVAVTNGAGGNLDGLAVGTITYGAGATGWLSATLSETVAPGTLRLQPSTTSLAAGAYTAKVQVTSSAAGVAPKEVSVTYTLRSVPVIGLGASTAAFVAVIGSALPASQVITISNAGSGSLGTLSSSVNYQGTTSGWLTTTLVPAGGGATLTIRPSTTALAVGRYTATVGISAPNAAGATIAVTYDLTQAVPIIALNPGTLSLTSEIQADPTTSPSFGNPAVTNTGAGSLTGLSTSVTYGPGGTGWLNAALAQTTAPTTLFVGRTFQAATLPIGTYQATIRVASTVPGVTAATLGVTFVVTGVPCIVVSPTSITFNTTQFTNPPPQVITVTNGCGGTLDRLYVDPGVVVTGTLSATTAPTTLTMRAVNAILPGPPIGTLTGFFTLFSDNSLCCMGRTPKQIPWTVNILPGVGTITVTPSPLTLPLGNSAQLTATVQSSTGVAKTVTWTSSSPFTVSVNANGLVTALAKGSATITAASTVDPTKTGTATVTVP